MAATRILIWLPVRLVRRSSISNMAFSPWRMFVFFKRASRLRTGGPGKLPCRRDERKGPFGNGSCCLNRYVEPTIADYGTDSFTLRWPDHVRSFRPVDPER